MRKTLDLFNAGDHVDVTTAAGDLLRDVSLWTLDQFGITVVPDKERTLTFLPWASVDRICAFTEMNPRRDSAPSFWDEESR